MRDTTLVGISNWIVKVGKRVAIVLQLDSNLSSLPRPYKLGPYFKSELLLRRLLEP